MKAGTGVNVYQYNPYSFEDTNLIISGGHAFSHLVFCFQNFVTTAAGVSVDGRVIDDAGNAFDYYRFDNPEVGNKYHISARHKKYSFETDTYLLVLNDAVENMDFKPSPQ